jgi:crossover junction endodeoxyribonuclease RusA
VEIEFPIAFVVYGTPVSQRARRPSGLEEWKRRIKEAAGSTIPHPHFASEGRMSVTLYYFPDAPMQGDIDNIVKPVLDALSQYVYLDDRQVERLVVQRFDPQHELVAGSASEGVRRGFSGTPPALYVRISDDPNEESKQ